MRARVAILTGIAALAAVGSWILFQRDVEATSRRAESRASREEPSADRPSAEAETRAASEPSRVKLDTAPPSPVVQETAPPAPVDDPNASPAKTATIEVYVVDAANGVAVEGARVCLWKPHGDPETATSWTVSGSDPEALTNAAGLARVDVPSGVVQRLHVKRPDDKGANVDKDVPRLLAGESRHVKIELPAVVDTVFHGRVVREGDSTPVAGARVRLTRETYTSIGGGPDSMPPPFAFATTDGDGHFNVSAPSWEQAFGRIDAAGQGTIVFDVVPGHASRDRACELAMPAGARLRVKVRRGGAPAAGVTIRATVNSYEISRPRDRAVIVLVDPSWDVNTDALGVGVLNGVTPGVPVVVEALEGSTVLRRFQTPLVLEPNETREIDVQLGGGVKILGTAQDQLGKPISGATVWLVNATHEVPLSIDTQHLFQSYEERHAIGKTTTNTNGAFTFDNVAAGEWWLGIAPDTHERMSAMEHRVSSNASYLMIPERAGDVTFTLRATRGLYIRGRVVKPDGSPAPNAFVHASGHRGGWMSDQTDDKGEFAVGPLIEGRYGVYASGTQKLAHSDPTTADAGASGVELRLKAGGAIRGRVIDESGEPCQANISLSRDLNRFDPSDLGRVIVMMTKTHPANEIELEGMEPGTYNLVASTSDGRIGVCGNVNVSAGSETSAVVITLRSTGTLVVKWAKGIVPSNYQIASEGVMIHFGIAVNSGDTGRISVPPGKGTLTYWLESGAVKAREFEVAAGKETEVVLDGKD